MYEIKEITKELLEEYSELSIAFESNKILEVINKPGTAGIELRESEVTPFKKDFDDEETPVDLWGKFDLTNWRIITYTDNTLVAGAIIAYQTSGVNMLEGRDDLAVVWDIRVNETYRRRGLGSGLVHEVIKWAKQNGVKRIKIESQNNNIQACKFYSKFGTISNINKHIYKEFPEEVQIIWSIDV